MRKYLNTLMGLAWSVRLEKKVIGLYCLIHAAISMAQLPLVPYRIGDKWGYADTSGKIKIPAFTYFHPMLFDEKGFAHFYDETERYGLIDPTGKILLKPEFENIEINFPYCIMGRYTELDYQTIINYNVEDSARLYYLNGQAIVKYAIQDYIFNSDIPKRLMIIKNNNILLFDINWKTRTSRLLTKFNQADFAGYIFGNGNAVVGYTIATTGKEGQSIIKHYDINGRLNKPSPDMAVSEPSSRDDQGYKDLGEAAPMMDPSDDQSNYSTPVISKVNNQYTLYADPTYRNAKFYDQIIPVETKAGYFLCRLNQQWGLAYKNAKELIKPGYDTILPCRFITNVAMRGFGNFLTMQWMVKKDNKWGVINPENPVFNIPVLYDSIIPENYYHYLVKQEGRWGTINDTGGINIQPQMDLSYTHKDYLPVLAKYRNILMAGKVKNGYQLYSNLPIPLNEIYDTVTVNKWLYPDYFTLEHNGLKGKAFEWQERFYVLPCKYLSISPRENDIEFGHCLFTLVTLPNFKEAYIRQDGKAFFEP